MAELALEDRLQPALLDRLSDDARSLVVVEVRSSRARLAAGGVEEESVDYALRPFGLRRFRTAGDAPAGADTQPLALLFTGPTDGATLARVRAAPVAGASAAVPLAQVADVVSRSIQNVTLESAAQRVISMRQLRESVLRDVAWLLSTASHDSNRSLADWPEVARSVFNYGMPSMAGLAASTLDENTAAARLQKVIEAFEPRLSRVRVTPELDADRMDRRALSFRIEAELWGQPTPQRLLLRTQIDVETSDVVVTDAESG